MSWSTHTREARSEFQRLYLTSLIAAVERRVERHRARRQLLRLRLAERRLAELRRVARLVAEPPAVRVEDVARPLTALATVTAALLCSGAFLGVAVGLSLDPGVTAIADLAVLALTLVWFLLAVACSPRVG